MNIPHSLTRAIEQIADRWSETRSPWLIGGSCGLLFQSVPIHAVPRDLDIYIDQLEGSSFHQGLAPYSVDEPAYSETDKYRSTLSHYSIAGVSVELVAGFQVFAPGAEYSIQVKEVMTRFAGEISLNGVTVRLMPLAHELLFNLLRDRPDRYEAIAGKMREQLEDHLPPVIEIVRENRFGSVWLSRISELLGIDVDVLQAKRGPEHA